MKKIIFFLFLSLSQLVCFSQTTKLWITAKANAGTSLQVDNDIEVVNGAETLNLASPSILCSSTSNINIQTYHVSIEDDYDNDGTIDQIEFDLIVKGYENSIFSYSEDENKSSMTKLGTISDVSLGNNTWGVNNQEDISDIDEGESIVFTIENLKALNLDEKFELEFDGFNLLGVFETNGGHTHKIIKGEGTNLISYTTNFSRDYDIEGENKVVLTGAGSVVLADTREWGLSSIRFSITLNDTESGGFNDLSDYSLFSNASNFGETYPEQTKEVIQSEFCWDKIPRWLAFRNTEALTDEEVTDIASHYQVVLLEKANNQGLSTVDEGMVSVATRLKAENPNITTLFYWNTWINYSGYSVQDEYSMNANLWSDLDNEGNPVLFKDLYYTYNYDVEALRDWWIKAPIEAMQYDVLDGVFIDKVVSGAFKDVFPNGNPANNYVKMLEDLYNAMPEGKKVIGNIIRTERTNSNRGLMEVADGSYMERWAFPGTALNEAEATAISIQAMREALSKGKEIHFQTSPHDTGGDAEPDDYAGKVQYAKDNVNYPLAVYLIFAEEGAYFSYQVSVNARSSAKEAWNTSFIDEFSYRLGAPLGPPTKNGYVYQRSYENVDVWVDLVTKEAILNWKDKTKITSTECTTIVAISEKIEAEDFDDMSGIQTEVSTESGDNVGYINNGDWLRFDDVNLSGISNIDARVATRTSGGTIEVRTGSSTGTLIGSITVNNTGGFQNWITTNTAINNTTGIQDVYLVFTGGNGYLFNVNWIEFNKNTKSNKDFVTANKENNIIIYPNPVESLTTIEGAANSIITIYDINGRIILTKNIFSSNETVDLSLLRTGIFYAKVESQTNVSVIKIVKE